MQNTGEQAWMQGDFGHHKNPYGDSDHLLATAEHETEALLDHLFEHDNTAPFIAIRLIQRLIGSNPTPRFVKVRPLGLFKREFCSRILCCTNRRRECLEY